MSSISQINARETLDSRGNPTVEVDVILSDGSIGRGSAPSGASVGSNEALELRDDDMDRYGGLGTINALTIIQEQISPALIGCSALVQSKLDNILISLDGTTDKSRLGGNAMVCVSIAVAHAAAKSIGVPLYKHLSGTFPFTLPIPMFNILNGGKHAENSTDFQEFMVVPSGLSSFKESVRAGAEIYHSMKILISEKQSITTVGDEGGFAPHGSTNREALDLIIAAVEKAGYKPGDECLIAIDVAANELLNSSGSYDLPGDGMELTAKQLIDEYENLANSYPIYSIEDGIAEHDWANWSSLTSRLGDKLQIVGDDLYTTNTQLIKKGAKEKSSNSVLIKLNQIGTVTETIAAINLAKELGWGTIISHRSGETEDTTIADLAVGTAAGQIKAGAPSRGERVAKYNQLLRIEQELGPRAHYAGGSMSTKNGKV